MAKKKEKTDSGRVEQPQMTPMIDCVFLLLIFFMLAANFKTTEGNLKAYLPKDRGQGTSNPVVDLGEMRVKLLWCHPGTRTEFRKRQRGESFEAYFKEVKYGEVVLKVKNKYFSSFEFGGEKWPDYRELLRDIIEAKGHYNPPSFDPNKEMPLIIDAREAVPWKHVVAVLDKAMEAGLKDITFAAPEVPY